jgi:CDP-diacylglycerol--glycerol-3-phosphate 3-phosphatidyltransferase
MTLRDRLQQLLHRILDPAVRLFIRAGLTPNSITTIGLVLNLGVAAVLIYGAEHGARDDFSYLGWGGVLILFAGLFDMMDGQVARIGNMSSRFGALYDSVVDRYSELFMFLGICYYLVAHHFFISSMIAFIALIGSMMVSYTRARAEGLGIPCKEGLMQRPERVVLVGFSAILCWILSGIYGGDTRWTLPGLPADTFEFVAVFSLPMAAVAVMANYTALQRLYISYRFLEAQESGRNSSGT